MKKKILVTGMTAQQHSSTVASRSLSFAGSLARGLEELGYSVHFAEPSVEWTSQSFSEYSKVLVGIAPPLSVTSNSTYGALSTVSVLAQDDRLRLFIDAPEPWKIFANLRAVEKDGDKLFKKFYSRRKGYSAMVESSSLREQVLTGAAVLSNDAWSPTAFPRLPWSDDTSVLLGVPENAVPSMTAMNTDSFSLTDSTNFNTSRSRRWLVENESTRWATNTMASLTAPCVSIKENKLRTDADLYTALAASMGALIGPHGNKTSWWSSTFVHALNAGTPIATDWVLSSRIGSAWNHIAASIEEMSQIDHYELSVTQKTRYLGSITNQIDTLTHIQQFIGK